MCEMLLDLLDEVEDESVLGQLLLEALLEEELRQSERLWDKESWVEFEV